MSITSGSVLSFLTEDFVDKINLDTSRSQICCQICNKPLEEYGTWTNNIIVYTGWKRIDELISPVSDLCAICYDLGQKNYRTIK